jgi:DNA (cytosine-5)-methyltransferase 1
MQNGKIIEMIKKDFENIGYSVDYKLVNASDYGVPQNRERVLFIGCRKDQKLISEIEPTVSESEKVAIFEALYDLDFIDNDEKKSDYIDIDLNARYNGFGEKYAKLIRPREIDGKINSKNGKTYSEWSKQGRLNGRFKKAEAFYVKNFTDLKSNKKTYGILHNHQTSNQKEDVIKRLDIILKHGDYVTAKKELSNCGLDSQKRNYNVLKADGISPTVMTIPDDYVHFSSPRALTVREMARLQSFDDSFVFQGKRSTGGEKRREEIPQFTLVGNAVPPLLARAVAMKILKNIK